MSHVNSLQPGLLKIPLIEQAFEWLVHNGPIVQDPQLPNWMLRRLVEQQRILRLHRGLYLIPGRDGILPSLLATLGLLAPDGHLSFYAALCLHGLTDQDPHKWTVITSSQQSTAHYGQRPIRFFVSPVRAATTQIMHVEVDDATVRVATPDQAFVDALRFPRHGAELSEMLHVLRNGLITRRLQESRLRHLAEVEDSPTLARRLGFLLNCATRRVNPRLLRLAHRTHDRSTTASGPVRATDKTWRVALPGTRQQVESGARV